VAIAEATFNDGLNSGIKCLTCSNTDCTKYCFARRTRICDT